MTAATELSRVRLSATIPRELLAEIRALAAANDRSVSREITRALRLYLDGEDRED